MNTNTSEGGHLAINNNNTEEKMSLGIDFILHHFQQPIFPRKIMTKDLGYQLEVFDKQEALHYFKSSRYEDCRINAYPPFTDYHGINRTPISFLMIDMDLSFGRRGEGSSNKEKSLKKALNKTLEKIKKETIGGNPTVLWTGNGYHIYQPVSGGFILEEYETFYEFTKHLDKDLTSLFIQFAEEYFTDYAADPLHNPTVKSCLLRVPGSLNSKCILNKGEVTVDPEVNIIQKWDGKTPSIQPLLRDFRRWLIQKRIDEAVELKKQSEKKKHDRFHMVVAPKDQKGNGETNRIEWIEKGILENPLPDHRKYVIWRILSPYLMNVKKLPKEESYTTIENWLDKCNKLERLNFNTKLKIREGLKGASKGYYPISLEKLKEENKELYDIIIIVSRHE
jgi:Primase X